MSVVTQALVDRLRADFCLDWRGVHGAPHWARVRANGLTLAKLTGAHTNVVELFAFLHDSCRVGEFEDGFHGARAAQYAEELHGTYFDLSKGDMSLLQQACEMHSDGLLDADPTVQTCWDADRLDLGRVGIEPDPRYLCTSAARNPLVLKWAFERSIGRSPSK